MKIVVECTCQVPYEFEIEPVDGKMSRSVFCPTCGADGTEYANWVIQETLAQETAQTPMIEPQGTVDVDEPVAETSRPAEPTEATDEGAPGLPKSCHVHKDQPMEAFCFTCKKPICLKCMKQSGYFCSAYCRNRAEQAGMDIPEYEGQERFVRAGEYTRAKRMGAAVVLALVALFVAYEWYEIYGQKPSTRFSMPITSDNRLQRAQFLSDHELLLVSSDKVSAYDFKKKQPVWSNSLGAYRSAPPPVPSPTAPVDETNETVKPTTPDAAQPLAQRKLAEQLAVYEDYYAPNTGVRVVGDRIWVTLGRNVIGFDRATGAEKVKTQVEGRIQEMTFADDAMVVVSAKGAYDRVFTRIELPSGTQRTEQRSIPPPAPRRPGEDRLEDLYLPKERHEFVPAGSTVAGLDVKLIEKNLVTVETMKKPQDSKRFDDLKVTQTREYAEDVLNEMRRMKTGGVAKVDQSRYAVTIQRVFGKDVEPWTGEVVGSPALFALKTVDVLVAGNVVHVFNRSNQKIWESTLSYPIAERFQSHGSWWGVGQRELAAAPCMEMGDTLYFFDQGVLTAFDIKSGTARWRMPSVGISTIQFDNQGLLYVTTTSANPESIRYSEQVSLEKVEPIIVKVDPVTGRPLWRVEKVGDQCYLAGKYVYITRAQTPAGLVALASGGAAATSFRLYRLNPRNGKQLWEYYRSGGPGSLDFYDNEILFQSSDKLEVLKFLSL